jgi:hypothetical protein
MSALQVTAALALMGIGSEIQAYHLESARAHGLGLGLILGALESIQLVLLWEHTTEEQRTRASKLTTHLLLIGLGLCTCLWGVVPLLPTLGTSPLILGQGGNVILGISASLWVVVRYMTPPTRRKWWSERNLAKVRVRS